MDAKAALQRAVEELARQRAEIAALRSGSADPIAIVGMACRLPGGADTPAAFWDLLDRGVDAVTEVPRDRWNADAFYDADPSVAGKMTTKAGAFITGVDRFDPQFFGIAPREAPSMDPQQRVLLEVVWEALENANIPATSLYGSATGVFVGITCFDHAIRLSQSVEDFGAYAGTGSALNMAPGRVSYVLGLTGPSMAIDTACSSALVSLHLACQSLRLRESNVALAGGVHLMLSPDVMVSFSQARMLAADGRSKTFDASADGYSRGEGCGVVVLKRYADAVADRNRILGVIRGTAVNQDGPSGGLTVPNGQAQRDVIRRALAAAGVEPADVAYVEAHGTGTSLGDPIEIEAMARAYRPERSTAAPLITGSAKTNIGHLEPASGIAGLIKILLAFEHEQIPRHLHLRTPNPHIAWATLPVTIATEPVAWPRAATRRIAGLSAFGFSGTNAHVIVEEPPAAAPAPAAAPRPLFLLVLSARTETALRLVADRYRQFIAAATPDLASVCYCAGAGRSHFPHRLAIVAESADAVLHALSAWMDGRPSASVVQGRAASADYRSDAQAITARLARAYDAIRRTPDARDAFDELAALYVEGASIDWTALSGPNVPASVTLPNYPFERQRYWLETRERDAAPEAAPPGEYEIVWQRLSAEAGRPDAVEGRRFVVASTPDDLATAIDRVLRARGASSVVSSPRDAAAAAAMNPTDIVFVGTAASSPDAVMSVCGDLLDLTQYVRRAGVAPRIWIVTRGAADVDGTLDIRSVAQAPLAAFAKVLGLEHPELFGRLIDAGAAVDLEDATAVVDEIGQRDDEDHVALRGGERYAPRVQEADRAVASAQGGVLIRADAAYLITGGLGALGLHTAAWLAARGARHLWLTGRTPMANANANARQRGAVAALEAQGVSVRTVAVDVADHDGMSAVLQEIGRGVAPLRGVVHAAGVAGYVDIEHLTRGQLDAVLRPKVRGAWTLHVLTRDLPLDFFVSFSSIASAWGSRGQAHYAAANAYLDALASARRASGLPATTINWGPWADGGMNSAEAETLLRRVGVRPLGTRAAVAALDAVVTAGRAHAIIADIDWRLFKGSYEARGHRRLLERLQVAENLPASPASGELAARVMSAAPSDRERILVDLVQTEVGHVLGLTSRPDQEHGLFAMGMDSLMALELRTRLETRAGFALPATLAFDYSSIQQIASFLLTRLSGDARRESSRPTAESRRTVAVPMPAALDVGTLSEEEAETLLLDKLKALE